MLTVPGNDKPGCRGASISKPKKGLLEPGREMVWEEGFLGEVELRLSLKDESYHPGVCYLGNCKASSARHYSRMTV